MYRQSVKKLVKWQYLLHMSSQYSELQPTSSWDRFRSLQHPCKFQRVSHLGFITAQTSLNGRQPNFARCLAISCAGILYIHFLGLLPPNGILPGAKFTCVQVFHSPILTALLHGTWAVGVIRSLRYGTSNGITELLQRAPPIFGTAAITLGIGLHSSSFLVLPWCWSFIS